jgi:hypothetical protein
MQVKHSPNTTHKGKQEINSESVPPTEADRSSDVSPSLAEEQRKKAPKESLYNCLLAILLLLLVVTNHKVK